MTSSLPTTFYQTRHRILLILTDQIETFANSPPLPQDVAERLVRLLENWLGSITMFYEKLPEVIYAPHLMGQIAQVQLALLEATESFGETLYVGPNSLYLLQEIKARLEVIEVPEEYVSVFTT